MVKIVTGKINSYKSTRLKEYYDKHPSGDGFIAIKKMIGNKVHSYSLLQLSSHKFIPYIIRDEFYNNEDEIIYQKGPYLFLKSAIVYLEKVIDESLNNNISPIFLDEISLLELEEKGLYSALNKCLNKNVDVCMVVREDLLEAVITKFNIKEYEMIGD